MILTDNWEEEEPSFKEGGLWSWVWSPLQCAWCAVSGHTTPASLSVNRNHIGRFVGYGRIKWDGALMVTSSWWVLCACSSCAASRARCLHSGNVAPALEPPCEPGAGCDIPGCVNLNRLGLFLCLHFPNCKTGVILVSTCFLGLLWGLNGFL